MAVPIQAISKEPRRKLTRRQLVLSLGTAAGIVGGAWLIGDRSGFDTIGKGGVNSSLLPKIGDPAPDFVVPDPEGNPVTLSQFHGQPVWLNFWGAWCPPCRAEMPDVQAAYEELAPKGLVLLAVSLGDKPGAAEEFAAKNNVTFRILLDPDRSQTSAAYPIYNFPTHVFIDAEGVVRRIELREMSKDQAVNAARSILPTD
jgi:peroxiredoxin